MANAHTNADNTFDACLTRTTWWRFMCSIALYVKIDWYDGKETIFFHSVLFRGNAVNLIADKEFDACQISNALEH